MNLIKVKLCLSHESITQEDLRIINKIELDLIVANVVANCLSVCLNTSVKNMIFIK